MSFKYVLGSGDWLKISLVTRDSNSDQMTRNQCYNSIFFQVASAVSGDDTNKPRCSRKNFIFIAFDLLEITASKR